MPLRNKSEIDCLTKKQKEMKGLLTELAIDDVMDDIWLCLIYVLWVWVFVCMSVIVVMFYMFIELARYSVDPEINHGVLS